MRICSIIEPALKFLFPGMGCYKNIFQYSPVATLEEDLSQVKKFLRKQFQVDSFEEFSLTIDAQPHILDTVLSKVKIKDANLETLNLFEAENIKELKSKFAYIFRNLSALEHKKELYMMYTGQTFMEFSTEAESLKGKKLKLLLRLYVSPQNQKKYNRVFLSLIDITKQKNTETQLLKTIRELNDIKIALDKAAILSVTDTTGIITWVNDSFCQTTKYSKSELIGMDHRILSSGYHSKKFYRKMWQTIKKGRIWKGELKNTTKDGSVFWVDTTIVPFLDEQNHPYQYVAIHNDISSKKSFEQLKKSEKHFKVISEVVPEKMWAIHEDGTCEFVNKLWLDYTGKSKHEITAHGFKNVIHPDDWNEFSRTWKNAYHSRSLFEIKAGLKEVNSNTYRHHLIRAMPFKNKNGKVVRWIGACTDISDLRQAKLQAEKANKAKSAFLANMSHEIRTPLNSILGMSSLLSETALEPKQEKYIKILEKAGKHLSYLINDILDFSKVEANQLTLSIQKFNLYDSIKNAMDIMSVQAERKGITLNFSSEPEYSNFFVMGDSFRLEQILFNLLSNAVKFTNKGFVNISMKIEESGNNIGVRFVFQDSGIGIPKNRLKAIFEEFEQIQQIGQKTTSGTGLGLAITKKLIQIMHGSISVTSQVDIGSTFKIYIPFLKAEGQTFQKINVKTPILFAQKKYSILVADDNEDNRFIIEKYLENQNYAVRFASNGMEAVELFKKHHFDLILMDIRMPVMDGYTATKHIRQIEKEKNATQLVPIFALSASASTEEVDIALNIGCNAHVPKPINKPKLLRDIHQYIGNASKSETLKSSDVFLKNRIDGFLQRQRDSLTEIWKVFSKTKNYSMCEDYGHKLAGTGGTFGFDELSELGRQLEHAAQNTNDVTIKVIIQKILLFFQNQERKIS